MVACLRCILDENDDPALGLDARGVCRHCRAYDEAAARTVLGGAEGERRLAAAVDEIKRLGAGQRYDCILGLSGGCDSSYLAWLAHRHGLRPLVVHFDNGWNSVEAVSNIENIVKRLGWDLHTYVVDWEEFKDVQLAYLRASVIDVEAITDHAILGAVHRLAKEHRIRRILAGTNVVTEAVLPAHWIFNKYDHVNLRAIHARYGKLKLRNFPLFDWKLKAYCRRWLKVETVAPLNWVRYDKRDAKKLLADELGWRDYGPKHGESIFTRFYQCWILPRKFGVDKRKAHLSNLICSQQMTRDQALEEMKRPIYDPELEKIDHRFVLKKLGLSAAELDEIMALPVRSHLEFPVEQPLHRKHPLLAPLKLVTQWGARR
jgi:N-acetyl sugar amidotransferase